MVFSRFIILIAVVGVCLGCRKDHPLTTAQTCSGFISAEAETYFLSAAYNFTLQEIASDSNHIGYHNFDIDASTVQCYLGKLAAIYQNASDSTSAMHDMIFKYGVNMAEPSVDLYSILAKFYSSSKILKELQANADVISDPFVNKMKNEYWLFPQVLSPGLDQWIVFYSDTPFNLVYVKENLKKVSEVQYVSFNSYFANGNGIVHYKNGANDIFTFDYGWGDCPSGCFYHHFWKIEVDENCSVSLIEEYGVELPQ